MDKEKLLKNFTIKFIAETVISCSVLFIWVYLFTYDILSAREWVISGLVGIAICLTIGYILNKGDKDRREMLRIMPMIISIHDTPESLKAERRILDILYVLSFGFGFALRDISLIFVILWSLSFVFRRFSELTNEKIKYLENKPEGV